MLQDLLRGVRDRVVVAVTFLAMLELMKRREIVVEQAEPWGPIMARRTTPEERAAAGVPGAIDEEAPAGRVAGVVRMTIDDLGTARGRRRSPMPRRRRGAEVAAATAEPPRRAS